MLLNKLIFRNTLWLSFSFLLTRGLSVIWNVLLAKFFALKVLELSIYMYILTQYAIFSILVEGNISYSLQHYIAKADLDKNKAFNKYWSLSFYVRLLLGIIFSITLYATIVYQYPKQELEALLASTALFFFGVGSSSVGIYIAFNDFKLQIRSYLINSITFTLGAIIVVLNVQNIISVLTVLIFSNFLGALYSLGYTIKEYKLPNIFSISFNELKTIIVFSAPLLVGSFCFTFYYRSDINTIAKIGTPEEVTNLSFALMFFFLIGDLIWSQLAAAITPSLIRSWAQSFKGRRDSMADLSHILRIYSLITIILIIGIHLMGPTLIDLLFGTNTHYFEILPLLSSLLLGLPFMVAYAFLYRIFLIQNTSIKFALYSILFTIIKFFTFKSIIQFFSLEVATTISGLIMILVFLSFILFMKSIKPFRNNLIKILFSMTIPFFLMMGFKYYIKISTINIKLILFCFGLLLFEVIRTYPSFNFFFNRKNK